MSLKSDIRAAWRGGPGVWRDLLVATWELARANITLRRASPERLQLLDHAARSDIEQQLSSRQRALIERVAYAVPIIGLRLPWRSDCLVQALAARRWLARADVPADLCLGVRRGEGFAAHAWLRVGERIVTGGEVSAYAELTRERASSQ